jgi:hypothetical protein
MSFNIGVLHFCFHVPKKDAMKFANQASPFFFPTLRDMANSIWNWSLSSFLLLH